MKKSIVTFAAATALAGTLSASHLTTAQSDLSVDEAVKKFEKAVASRNITVFDVIEHSKLADQAGLKMTDTTVVIVGSPKIGTLLMQCEPKIALELPLKFLFYKDGDKTVIAYEDISNAALLICNGYDFAHENFPKFVLNRLILQKTYFVQV